MANTVTAKVKHRWSDASGKTAVASHSVALPEPLVTSFAVGTQETNLTAIISKQDALCDSKYSGAVIVLNLPVSLSSPKSAAVAGSSARRHAGVNFSGAAGENTVVELVSTHVPDPADTYVDNSGTRPALNSQNEDVQTFITAMTTNANTASGEAVAAYKGSFIRQRVTTPRSRQ